MVNKKASRRIHNYPVHRRDFYIFVRVINESNGINAAAIFSGGPVGFVEPVEIIGVNNREKGIAEGDFAKWEAVFVLAILNHRPGENPVQPFRNRYC